MKKQIGVIGVDAGLCWIGDPCYILHKDKKAKESHNQTPKAIGKDWIDFCDKICDNNYGKYMQFNYDLGHAGLGVVVETGYGDGTYPVFAEFIDDGSVAKVWVEFISDNKNIEEDRDFEDPGENRTFLDD